MKTSMKLKNLGRICLAGILAASMLTGCLSAKPKDAPAAQEGSSASQGEAEAGGTTGGKKVIVVDGGGDQVDFNSTKSMEKSDANPYPYNELEMLAKEYTEAHPDVEVQVLTTSKCKERETLVPLLKAKKAPDIIFQNFGTSKNENLADDWVVPLDEYLEQPNPYVEGNERWYDEFTPAWMEAMRSMDGKMRFVPLDAIPIGIIYNQDLFDQAGIEKAPETYEEFMAAQEKLNAIGVIPYMPIYHWYEIVCEGSILSSKIPDLDVIIKDGTIDAQEYARGYEKGLISLKDPEYADWLTVMKDRTKYYPKGWQSTDVMGSFVQGQIGMIEAVGVHMRMIRDDQTRSFEVGTIPFPLLTKETSQYVDKGIIRGSAGYSTCWQISNAAVEKGTVDECVDFLRFLTTKENNERMVNALSATTPAVVGAQPVELFQPLNAMAEQDMKDGYYDWHASCIFTAFDADLLDTYEKDLYVSYLLGSIDQNQFAEKGDEAIRAAIARFEKTANWDKSKW